MFAGLLDLLRVEAVSETDGVPDWVLAIEFVSSGASTCRAAKPQRSSVHSKQWRAEPVTVRLHSHSVALWAQRCLDGSVAGTGVWVSPGEGLVVLDMCPVEDVCETDGLLGLVSVVELVFFGVLIYGTCPVVAALLEDMVTIGIDKML